MTSPNPYTLRRADFGAYDIVVDGEVVGRVAPVNFRTYSPLGKETGQERAWRLDPHLGLDDYDTRREAVHEFLAELDRRRQTTQEMLMKTQKPKPTCRCGYQAESQQDLDEHVLAMMNVDDGSHHGER